MEANTETGDINIVQISWGTGIFGNKTDEILKWLKKMNSLPVNKREAHYFGK